MDEQTTNTKKQGEISRKKQKRRLRKTEKSYEKEGKIRPKFTETPKLTGGELVTKSNNAKN